MKKVSFPRNSDTIILMNHSKVIDILKQSATYNLAKLLLEQAEDFFETLGEMGIRFVQVIKLIFSDIFKREMNWKLVVDQCSRFAVDSLPITLSIVGMCSIIISMQVAPEMVKQGGEKFVGMLMGVVMTRELGAIMSGFAIISMIGSSIASEIATMRVTEQIDAIRVLKVDPIRYLFVPRVLSGILMMPPVLVVSSLVGIVGGGIASHLASGLSYRAFFESVWSGLFIKDMNVALLKAVVFGFTIALISCVCGYNAKGGAKGVGEATTKAVVWSFVGIVLWDLLFSIIFFF